MITDPLSSLNNLYAKDDSRQDERIFRGICCSSDPDFAFTRAAPFAIRGRTDCPCRDKELGFRLSLSLGSP
jgi:hypothetical protein